MSEIRRSASNEAVSELVEAMEDILKDYEIIARLTGLQPEDFENIRRARAIIAKAKGENKDE